MCKHTTNLNYIWALFIPNIGHGEWGQLGEGLEYGWWVFWVQILSQCHCCRLKTQLTCTYKERGGD